MFEAGALDDNAKQLYALRERRFDDIVALRTPDRVPVIPLVTTYFPTRVKGISNRDAGYDQPLRFRCMKEAVLEYGWDFAVPNGLFTSQGLDAIGTRQVRWPGGDLADDAPFQFVEGEYVTEDEYDELLADPDRFTLTKIFPRIAAEFGGLGEIPLPPLHWFSNAYYVQNVAASLLASPPLRKVLDALVRLADAAEVSNVARQAHIEEMAALGYPWLWFGLTMTAFDLVSDYFRGLKGSSLDIYRQPEKLEAAMELMRPASIEMPLAAAKMTGVSRVFIPMHRGADNFMSEEAFERFYWPTFKELVEALIAAGITPIPLFEGRYTSRLKYLAELPAGKVAAHFDFVDRRKFKETCADTMCFWGNVPASLMCTGSPQEVKDDVKRLIDLFGGSLIIDCNLGMPDEARPENVMALREAADEYGVL
jgi:hypothetical protein